MEVRVAGNSRKPKSPRRAVSFFYREEPQPVGAQENHPMISPMYTASIR